MSVRHECDCERMRDREAQRERERETPEAPQDAMDWAVVLWMEAEALVELWTSMCRRPEPR